MWKKLIIVILMLAPMAIMATPLLAVPFAELMGSPRVSGITTQDVLVTATPNLVGGGSSGAASPPTYLRALYASPSEVRLTWGLGASATRTQVRAKYTGYPEDTGDGYLVYEGTGTTTDDSGVNFDEYLGTVYYRAWSGNVTDWTTGSYAQDELENPLMADLVEELNRLLNLLFMVLPVFAVLGLSGLAFWKPNTVLFMLAAGASMITGLYWEAGETGLRVSIGLIFIMYAFLCLAYAYRMLFWQGTPRSDE